MADFAINAEIISRCMDNDNNKFIEAFDKNVKIQVEEAIAANAIASAVVKLAEDKQEGWQGTNTELLAKLEEIAYDLKINTNSKSWPKSPSILSRRINEAKTSLREVGIIIDRYVIDQKKNIKGIKICKVPSNATSATRSSKSCSNY